ncbi:MAG: diguanylate cyclase [Bryobacteraceae bacterium]
MRILVAEDNHVSRRRLEAMLSTWGYQVQPAADVAQIMSALRSNDPPQMALLDWGLPGIREAHLCRRIRESAGTRYVYIVLLTSVNESDGVVEALDFGADDFVTNPFDPHELRARLRTGQRLLQLEARLLSIQEALSEQAARDPLTGLLNRRAIFDIFHRELDRARREGKPLAVVMADLDRFKQVNDTYGHLGGDAVLAEAARRMKASMRSYDHVGRYGGEEFLIVLPGCDTRTGAIQAERLRQEVAQPISVSGEEITVTCSYGVASTADVPGWEMDTLVRLADDALYRAKRKGRNRVESHPEVRVE